ncbi:MAG: phage terminase large subunit [Magnetococcales bacterium]|nr:phage terminase large subunit [Magnetococcales bacterium]
MKYAKITNKQFQEKLNNLSERLKESIEKEVTGLDCGIKVTKKRVEEGRNNFRFFAKTYFPHYISQHDSTLHTYLYQRLDTLVKTKKRGTKLVIAAPRSEAKSTLVTQIFTLWCLVTGKKVFITIIMDALHQATTMLESIKAELEANPRLKQDYPQSFGKGATWNDGIAITKNGARVQAFGSGTRMRGLRHGAKRPDLVICDDLENDENVRSRKQRDKLDEWLRSVVLKLGPPDDSMDVLCVGTILHHDSLLSRLFNNPLWESKRFCAIISWPDNMPLWDRWQDILNQDGESQADQFYLQHKKAMEAGAIISWPHVRSLETLMKIRCRDGADTFDAELQNQPQHHNAPFQNFSYWTQENPEWLYFGAVDPSMGKSGNRGDPSAIIVAGYDRETGVLNVVEADIRRRHPDQIIADVIASQERYDCRLWVVETVQFQEFFKDELIRRSARVNIPIPAKGIKPLRDKELRISSLQPHINNGLIRFHRSCNTLIEQLRHWGEGESHDDGPDALEMVYKAAIEGSGKIGEHRSSGQRFSANDYDRSQGSGFNDAGFGVAENQMQWRGY